MHERPDELARLRHAAISVRRRATATVLCASVGVLGVLFLLGVVVSGPEHSLLSLAIGLLMVAVAAAAGWAAGAASRALDITRLAAEAESAAGLKAGEVLAALQLERLAGGESASLANLHRRRIAERVGQIATPVLFPGSLPAWRNRLRLALVAATVGVGATVLAAAARPERAMGTARSLATPWRVLFPAPLPPMRVLPGDTSVARGSELEVRIHAPGRARVVLLWRVTGEVASSRQLEVDNEAWASGHAGPIRAPTRYWVEDGRGGISDTFEVRPHVPLLLAELRARVVHPAYLRRADEEYAQPLPPLVVPEGSRIEISGTATARLAAIALEAVAAADGSSATQPGPRPPSRVALDVNGRRFAGVLDPIAGGTWVWRLEPLEIHEEVIAPLPLSVAVVADSTPRVQIAYPGTDTVLRSDLQLPLVIDASDDIGVRDVQLVSWRVSALGVRDEPESRMVAEGGFGETRVVVRPTLDMRGRNLLPGDTVYYVARVRDRNPSHRAVHSDTFRARLPSVAELREAAATGTDRLAAEARDLAGRARELEREAREAERQAGNEAARARQATNQTSANERVSYEATEEARRVLQQANRLEEQMRGMREALETLRDEMEASGLADAELREKLNQLEELYRELMESGLREQIARLQEALRSLNPDELQASLRDVARNIRELQDQIEQSTALLERVAIEQAVQAARQDIEELATNQEAVTSSARPDSGWARAEERLANEAERLIGRLAELGERLEAIGADAVADSAGTAGTRLSDAARDMRQAASDARSRQNTSAGQAARASASSASESVQQAAASMAAAERQLTADWRQEAMGAVQAALGESVALAREQSALSGSSPEAASSPDYRARQLALREGLDNLLRALSEASRRTALLDRRTGPAAAEVADRMDAVLDRMQRSPGVTRPSPSEGEAIVEALNELAASLLATAQAITGSESATGMQEALEQMAQIAQAQQGIGQRTSGLLPLYQAGQRIQEQLAQLAREQAGVAQQLRDLAEQREARDALGRPERMAVEAEEIASRLGSGTLDQETIARQERLFRRLLDAGRSLEKEDRDPRRRESQTGTTVEGEAPAPLDPTLLSGPRYPHPSQQLLSKYPPSYRALIFDYFDRLNARQPAGSESGS